MKSRLGTFCVLVCCCLMAIAVPLDGRITYQGQLEQKGAVGNGDYDFQFELFDLDAGGLAVAPPVLLEDVSVDNGVFTVDLNFGVDPFAGDQLWPEISVRPGADTGGFTGLLPRQPIRPTPYALHAEYVALNAIGSDEIRDQSIAAVDIADGAVGSVQIADNAVGSSEIANSAIGASEIANGAVRAREIAADAVGASEIANGAVGVAEVDASEVQLRVSACGAGSTIQSVNQDGSVVCHVDGIGPQYWSPNAGTALEPDGPNLDRHHLKIP